MKAVSNEQHTNAHTHRNKPFVYHFLFHTTFRIDFSFGNSNCVLRPSRIVQALICYSCCCRCSSISSVYERMRTKVSILVKTSSVPDSKHKFTQEQISLNLLQTTSLSLSVFTYAVCMYVLHALFSLSLSSYIVNVFLGFLHFLSKKRYSVVCCVLVGLL